MKKQISKTPNNNGWTPERRRKQAEAIKNWKPWEKSTGPRTAMGKRRSSLNAITNGEFSPLLIEYDHLLRLNRAFMKQNLRLLQLDETYRLMLMRTVRLSKKAAKNELMDEYNKIKGLDYKTDTPLPPELMDDGKL